jgi:7-cyano-7-deazaguanine reductase
MSDAHQSPLGRNVQYADQYAPELLFPILRQEKRTELDIHSALPFFGVDIWNGYELGWLNMRGKPQVAVMQCIIPADSPYLIESKSFKLYLNSFNNTRIASVEALRDVLIHDLSEAAGKSVQVRLTLPENFVGLRRGELEGELLDRLDIETDCYSLNSGFLHAAHDEVPVEEVLVSHLLKSNCLVTGQPDWASVQIRYVGPQIEQGGLLKYLISFRNHNEFHEQCVERIFMDILRKCRPTKLAIYARYTRRGGLDINPFRTNFNAPWPENFRNGRQ